MDRKIVLIFVVLACVVVGVAGTVIALRFVDSNKINVKVVADGISLSVNGTSPYRVGDTLRFVAVHNGSQVGVPVTFYSDVSGANVSLGRVNTGVGGSSVLDVKVMNLTEFNVFGRAEFP